MVNKRTIHAIRNSTFLTRADVDPPVTLTIKEVRDEELDSSAGTQTKYVCYFDEVPKGLVLNWINSQAIARLLKSESFDDWPGGKIELFDDPGVMFGQQNCGRHPRASPGAASGRPRNQHPLNRHRSWSSS